MTDIICTLYLMLLAFELNYNYQSSTAVFPELFRKPEKLVRPNPMSEIQRIEQK